MFEADLVFSCGENNFLPVADVWLVIDVLRATTVITRWFELGGTELYPVQSPDEARRLVLELRERGSSPLLMGEVNGIPPEGFDLGNSPLELNYELIQEHYCGVMSSTNGLKIGNRIGILCSGRKKRPSWEDTLCAGAVIESLQARGEVLLSDSARIALTTWQSRENNLLSCVEKSNHAEYLKHIGYGRDIIFACEVDASTVVPMLVNDNTGRIILQSVDGSARPYATPRFERIKPEPVTNTKTSKISDPFEELLSYTKKPPQYFSTQK